MPMRVYLGGIPCKLGYLGGNPLKLGGAISGTVTPPPPPPPPPPAGTIIWQDRTDTAPTGQLTQASGTELWRPTFYSVPAEHMTRAAVVDDVGGGKMVRHTLPPDILGNFTVSPIIGGTVTDYGSIEYSMRFDPNFDWRWGGKMGPALVGVVPGHGIYEPTSGQVDRNVGFSTRSMWGGSVDGAGNSVGTTAGWKLYLYIRWPRDASDYPGWQSYGWQPDIIGSTLERNVWYKRRIVVKLNTIGKQDGLFEQWQNDVLVFRMTNVDYRMDANVHLQCVLYDIHRGGDLSGFWTSPRSSYIDVKDITVRDLTGTPSLTTRLLSDSFTASSRTSINSTALDYNSGGTVTGRSWTADANIGITTFVDVLGASHQLCYPASSTGYKQGTVDVGTPNTYTEVFMDTVHGAPVYVTGRGTDANNCYRVYANSNGSVAIGKLVAGTPTELWLGPTGRAKRQNFLGIDCNGTSITAYLNGLEVGSVTDTSLTTGNRCGIAYGAGSTTGRLVNFQVTTPQP
jgi:hypothetical protein